MKKLLVFFMAMMMSLSLIGCGGEDVTGDPVTEEQLAQEQAMADADYEQLLDLVANLSDHYGLSEELTTLLEKVRAGEVEESAALDHMKEMADHSQGLLEAVENAQWQTEYYKEHVDLFTAAVKALAEGERLSYEAGVENDETKLAEVEELLAEYNLKEDEFLDLMEQ